MIAFYVHHHGSGHLARTVSVVEQLTGPAAVLTSLDIAEASLPSNAVLVRLPPDTRSDAERTADITAHGALHWAPIGSGELTARTRSLVEWLTGTPPRLLVVDMSVEVLVQARLCGIATVAVRYHGRRDDRGHQLGYDCATELLAPYPREFEDPSTPANIAGRTFYGGLYSLQSGRRLSLSTARLQCRLGETDRVLAIAVGSGGTGIDLDTARSLAHVLPGWTIRVIGADGQPSADGSVRFEGWVDDPFPWLRAANVVAASAGANLTAVAAAGVPFLAIVEERPFEEQARRAEQLRHHGAAATSDGWPSLSDWPAKIDLALELGATKLTQWASEADPAVVAEWLESIAAKNTSPDPPA